MIFDVKDFQYKKKMRGVSIIKVVGIMMRGMGPVGKKVSSYQTCRSNPREALRQRHDLGEDEGLGGAESGRKMWERM